ncbi:MAG: hypothetical protein J3Q66DRAFT_78472 [Benniella sp.]|nr:MAG: hypothetical protein J3Q66DRAFT_78472 [Benniella sp.]
MQFKTLALVAIAAIVVSAQTFEDNPCTRCVLRSYTQDTSCKTLSTDDMNKLRAAIKPTKIEPLLLSAAVQKPEIKACVCHWSRTAFGPGGAASSCISGATPTCNDSQLDHVAGGVKNLGPFLGCGAA